MTIKFYQYYAQKDGIKVKIDYSLNCRLDGRKCVTIYAKEYGWKTFKDVFGDIAKNDTDLMTDYFEKSRANFFEDHPLYPELRAKAEYFIEKRRARRNY